jgi:hypothetical protein
MLLNFIKITLFLSFYANAEFRAYQYLVKDLGLENSDSVIQVSSMNPRTFKSFHGHKDLSMTLLSTWMCLGNTASKKTCPAPGSAIDEDLE